MLHLDVIFILIVLPFTKINPDEIFVEIVNCKILKITLLGGSPIPELYLYQVVNRTGKMEKELAYYFSEDEPHQFVQEDYFKSALSKLIDKQKSNASQIVFKDPNVESQIKLLIDIVTKHPTAIKHINLQYDDYNKCIYLDKRYLEIEIIDCDILHFKMKNIANCVFNDVYIYELGQQNNFLYYYNLELNTTRIGSYFFGLFTNTSTLNSSTIKLMKPQKNFEILFNIYIDAISASGIHYKNQSCITYERLTKCYNSDCMVIQNKIINVTFTPAIPEKDRRFCIKVWYTIKNNYFLDRLLFQAKNISGKINIYTFIKSSSNDTGQRLFNEQSVWASRIDKASNLSIDTVCFLKVEPSDINVTFYWNVKIKNRNNIYDKRDLIQQFQITKIKIVEQGVTKDSRKLEFIAFLILIIMIFPFIYLCRHHKNVNAKRQITTDEELNEMLSENGKNDTSLNKNEDNSISSRTQLI